MDDILFERRGAAGIITLNRPQALNALTHDMIRALRAQLRKWEDDDVIACVVIRGEGPRAFCSGGDIRAFHDSARKRDLNVRAFWADEYVLNAEIQRFAKPYVALMHGIAMGGGLGVSLHGTYRIADESLTLAMPEVGIGFFPDVGASWFLPRLPGETGTCLGLTGMRIGLADALALGLVTHRLERERWGDLLDALASGEAISTLLRNARPAGIEAPLDAHRRAIDAAFSAETVEEVLRRLDAEGGEWTRQTAKLMRSRSPTSLKVALAAMRKGRQATRFADCMKMEFRIANRMTGQADFLEGIRAAVIDKDHKPAWQPASLEAVDDGAVSAFFTPDPLGELGV